MNRYAELKRRQQAEFSAFPMQFAFSDRQFAEGMAALGLEPTDTDKVYKAPGGGFYRREDTRTSIPGRRRMSFSATRPRSTIWASSTRKPGPSTPTTSRRG